MWLTNCVHATGMNKNKWTAFTIRSTSEGLESAVLPWTLVAVT